MSTPCIACIGVIGKHDNPLHITLFPPYLPTPSPPPSIPGLTPKPPPQPTPAALLDFSFLLNASLDIFDARARDRTRIDQDLGLLQHVDERLSIWGHLTATGVRFAIVVDSWGKDGKGGGLERSGTGESLVEGRGGGKKGAKQVQAQDLKVAFRGLQTAWIRLVGNPFFVIDEGPPKAGGGGGGITSKRFEEEVRRIGDGWRPGLTVL